MFQAIQFSMSTQFSSILPIDRTLSGSTIPSQSGFGSDGNEGVLCIPQSSDITGTSPSDCLVSYPGHLLGGSYPSEKVQTVYSFLICFRFSHWPFLSFFTLAFDGFLLFSNDAFFMLSRFS